jgi:plasmid stabilization system protein ParE
LKNIEYSQIVRQKLKNLRAELKENFGEDFSIRTIREITAAIRRLEVFCESGTKLSNMYDIDTDYYYIFVKHNYFIYRIETDRIIIVQMFNEREDFMNKLFGISGRTNKSGEFWGE